MDIDYRVTPSFRWDAVQVLYFNRFRNVMVLQIPNAQVSIDEARSNPGCVSLSVSIPGSRYPRTQRETMAHRSRCSTTPRRPMGRMTTRCVFLFLLAAAGLGERDVDLADVLAGSHPLLGLVDALDAQVGTGLVVEDDPDPPIGDGLLRAIHEVVPRGPPDHLRTPRHKKELLALAGFQRRLGVLPPVVCVSAAFPGVVLADGPDADEGPGRGQQPPTDVPDPAPDPVVHDVEAAG